MKQVLLNSDHIKHQLEKTFLSKYNLKSFLFIQDGNHSNVRKKYILEKDLTDVESYDKKLF